MRKLQVAEDAAEKAQGAALIGGGEVESAEHEAEVVLVRGLHVRRRVVGGEHDLLNEIGEGVEVAGGGAGRGERACLRVRSVEEAGADGELVKADGGGLSEVHGGLARVGRDFDEVVAEGEVFAREAVFFWTEDDGDCSSIVEFAGDDGSEMVEADDGLLGFAVGERAGAEDEGGVANGFGEG